MILFVFLLKKRKVEAVQDVHQSTSIVPSLHDSNYLFDLFIASYMIQLPQAPLNVSLLKSCSMTCEIPSKREVKLVHKFIFLSIKGISVHEIVLVFGFLNLTKGFQKIMPIKGIFVDKKFLVFELLGYKGKNGIPQISPRQAQG